MFEVHVRKTSKILKFRGEAEVSIFEVENLRFEVFLGQESEVF